MFAEIKKKFPDVTTFTLGDSAALSTRLKDLIRDGRKTATCGALRDYDDGEEVMPVVGRRDIVLNWDGTPACLVETTEVTQCRFVEVTEEFALCEGENETRAQWVRDQEAYFERNGGFSPDMVLVCERFQLVEDYAPYVQ